MATNKITRPIVVLSTRTSTAHQWKNSNLMAWNNFDNYADEIGYDVVAIPDTALAWPVKFLAWAIAAKPSSRGRLILISSGALRHGRRDLIDAWWSSDVQPVQP